MDDEYLLFADALEELRDHPLELLDRLYSVTGGLAAETASAEGLGSHNYANWELEARFWDLAETLTASRDDRDGGMDVSDNESQAVYPFSPDSKVLEQYRLKHPQAQEAWLVTRWLQDKLPESADEDIEIRGNKWVHTKSEIASKKRLGGEYTIVSDMDADAPLRQKKPIAREDADYDTKTFRAVFELLRRRAVAEASQLAEKTGNLTLKMAINGLNGFAEPEIDPVSATKSVGITRRALWRRMCLSVAASPVGEYEKAVYGFLGGDLDSVLAVSDSWETKLLAYTNHICNAQYEDALSQAGRIPAKTRAIPAPISGHVGSVDEALELLAESPSPVVQQEAGNPLRLFTGAIINNTVEKIAASSADAFRRAMATSQPNRVTELPVILRVLVHLVLVLRQLGQEVQIADFDTLISSYVERLAYEHHLELVPLYLSFLDPNTAVDTYAYFLANISDPEERQEHLALGRKYGIDMRAAVKLAVERVFDENSTYEVPAVEAVRFEEDVDESDVRLYRAVEWFVEVKMWRETVEASVSLLRRFLLCGKTGATREAGVRLRLPYVLQQYEADTLGQMPDPAEDLNTLELSQLSHLVNFLDEYAKWESIMEDKRNGWKSQAIEAVGRIENLTHELINDWLVDVIARHEELDSEPANYAHLHVLRQIYIPYVILKLHHVLFSSRALSPGFLDEANNLSVLVASKQRHIYDLFIESGRLREFLEAVVLAASHM